MNKMIFSEICFILLVFLLSAQTSSLWSSLLVIPLSLVSILTSTNINWFSGIIVFLYIMVFIGGLLVLLVSVASISDLEQSFNLMKGWLILSIFIITPFLLSSDLMNTSTSYNLLLGWTMLNVIIMLFIILILLLALFVMSKLIMTFKNMIRSV